MMLVSTFLKYLSCFLLLSWFDLHLSCYSLQIYTTANLNLGFPLTSWEYKTFSVWIVHAWTLWILSVFTQGWFVCKSISLNCLYAYFFLFYPYTCLYMLKTWEGCLLFDELCPLRIDNRYFSVMGLCFTNLTITGPALMNLWSTLTSSHTWFWIHVDLYGWAHKLFYKMPAVRQYLIVSRLQAHLAFLLLYAHGHGSFHMIPFAPGFFPNDIFFIHT